MEQTCKRVNDDRIDKSEEGGRKMKLKKEMDDEIVRRDRAKRVTESYSRISRVLYHTNG